METGHPTSGIPLSELQRVVARALEEDLGWGDLTTDSLVPPSLRAVAVARAKKPGVLAGLEVFALVFQTVDPSVTVQPLLPDGTRIEPGDAVARIEGPAASILKGERVALNFLQRLSGVATLTAQFVDAVAGLSVRIVDTRKTTPGLRVLEKYAVRAGGGHNHRQNLSDGILIKDNHLVALHSEGKGIREAVARARARAPHTVKIQVEADTLEQAREAVEAGADAILLDNMTPDQLRQAMKIIAGRALAEASGGVNIENVRAIAETGVDLISIGALTHSAPALDIGLDFEES